MKRLRPGLAQLQGGLCFLAAILVLGLFALAAVPEGDTRDIVPGEPALHVILFEDYPYTASEEDPLPYRTVDLPSADFPEPFSSRFAPFHRLREVALPEGVEIPRKLILLDIHTFSKSDLEQRDMLHKNPYINLSYRVTVSAWKDGAYRAGFQGEYNGFKFSNIRLEGSFDKTKLITIRKTVRQTLFAVLTPATAIPLFLNAPDHPDLRHLETPAPVYSEKLTKSAKVRIRGIVTSEGRLDPDRFVLLECPHPALARAALATIIDHWRFEPARRNGRPVEALTTIEVEFPSN